MDMTWTLEGILAAIGIGSAFVIFLCSLVFASIVSALDYVRDVWIKVKSKLHKG